MTLDVKIPRWLAVALFAVWCVSLIENAVCLAINAHANLVYISGANSPPPPFPGPNVTQPPDEPKPKDGEKRRPILRPRKDRP